MTNKEKSKNFKQDIQFHIYSVDISTILRYLLVYICQDFNYILNNIKFRSNNFNNLSLKVLLYVTTILYVYTCKII